MLYLLVDYRLNRLLIRLVGGLYVLKHCSMVICECDLEVFIGHDNRRPCIDDRSAASHYHALSGSSHVPTDIPRNIIAGGPAESTLAPLFVLDIVYKEVESHRESYASLVYNPCVE